MPMNIDAATQALLRSRLSAPRGRVAAEVEITSIEPLTLEDMEALANPSPVGYVQPALNRIRASHHRIAQLVADGNKDVNISLITGMSANRICILKSDPAFLELIAYYLDIKEKVYVDVHEKLADLGTTALEEIRERLEEDPSKFKTRELLEIVEKTYDRSAAPSKLSGRASGNTNSPGLTVNIKFTDKGSSGVIIDQEAAQ